MFKIIGFTGACFLAALTLSSCKKEDALTPSTIDVIYKLPQGNNAFDADLVNYHNKYGSFFLYKFSNLDFGWQPTASGGSNGFGSAWSSDTADIAYVGVILPFVKNNWLSFYPDAMLKATLPYKVLFGKNLTRKTDNKKFNTTTGYNHITISNFSPVYDTMSLATKNQFKQDINLEFWNWIQVNNKIPVPAAFSTISNYSQTGVTAATMYQYGFLAPATSTTVGVLPAADFTNFIKAILTNTKERLDTTILKPTNDTKGLVKLKYNALIGYYKTTWNLDLQKVGDTPLIP